jgi:hypothetical protein
MDKESLLTLGRPQKHCQNCGAEIDKITHHPSIIRAAGTRTLERLDYCPQCWDYIKEEAWDSFWITRREVKARVPKLTRRQRSVALRALFESLWEHRENAENREVEAHLYFLAHLLMKWGGLKWRASDRDGEGREIVIFEDPASGDALRVAAVETTDEQLAAMQARIEEFLREYVTEDEEITL